MCVSVVFSPCDGRQPWFYQVFNSKYLAVEYYTTLNQTFNDIIMLVVFLWVMQRCNSRHIYVAVMLPVIVFITQVCTRFGVKPRVPSFVVCLVLSVSFCFVSQR